MDTHLSAQTVLLSGASGLLGAGLRHELQLRGVTALRLVRGVPRPGQLHWDPVDSKPIGNPDALEDCAAAVHLSGTSLVGHRWTAAYRRQMAASRIGSTLTLARLLAELRRPPAVLAVASAVGIYGDCGDELLDESSATGEGYLAELCSDWEAAAEPAHAAGIRVVHLRFGVVLSAAGGALAKMLPLFRLGLGGRLGSGSQWMSWISRSDAVRAICFALETPAMAGPVNLTAPEPVRNAEFTRVLAQALHRRAILPAPALALRLVFGQMADEALLASARVVPAKLQSAGFTFAQPTLQQALAAELA